MNITSNSAAIDADFLNHIVEINRPAPEIAKILSKILSALGVVAVIHPLVREKEIKLQPDKVKHLLSNSVILSPSFKDIFQDDASKKDYYKLLVRELYRKLSGNILDTGDQDVLTYWITGKSLGEVHSVSMCLICGCGIFLSDDNDSKYLKKIVEADRLGSIDVYDRKEILNQIGREVLIRSERRAFERTIRE